MSNNGSKWIRPTTRERIYRRDRHRCAYCKRGPNDGVILTLDHVVPLELGGTNKPTNLITACLSCNSSKQDQPLRAFLRLLEVRYDIDTKAIRRRINNRLRRVLPKL